MMDMFDWIITPFAFLCPIFTVVAIYYRAGLKKRLDAIDHPHSEDVFTFPGPETFYNTFIREPRVGQSNEAIKLYKKYKFAGRVVKYTLLFSLIVNLVRAIVINLS